MPIFCNRIVSSDFYSAKIRGPQGDTGPAGITGIGIQGATGLQGTQGTTGLSTIGVTGLQGAQGTTGLSTIGVTGLQGTQGTTGLSTIGVTGLQGAQGTTGLSTIGVTGLQGAQGATGVGSDGGSQGVTGLSGDPGSPGLDGSQGVTGLKGEDGLEGYPGSQGETGLTGTNSPGIAILSSEVSISNTSVETTILTYTQSANSLAVGSQFKFIFYGTHQNQNTSGTLTFRMYIGANASQTIVLASGSIRARTYMEYYGLATVRSIGSGGTYIGTGIYAIHTSATATTKAYQGGNSTSAVNTTASTDIKITAQWQTASATNILLVQNASIERIK